MANFEGLIRQALAGQNASDPAARERIYQSSRNALARMLEKSGKTGDDVVRLQFGRLEQSIASIEAEYAPQASDQSFQPAEMPTVEQAPEAVPAPIQDLEPQLSVDPAPEPAPEPSMPEPAPEPEPATAPEPVIPDPLPDPLVDAPEFDAQPSTPEPALDTPPPVPPAELPSQTPSTGLPPDYTPAPLFPPVGMEQPVTPTPAPELLAEENRPLSVLEQELGSEAQTRFEAPVEPQHVPAAEAPAPVQSDPVSEAAALGPDAHYSAPAEYAEAAVSPEPSPPVEPYLGDVTAEPNMDVSGNYTATDDLAAERDLPPTYKRKHPLLRRIWPIFLAIAVLLVILWILYALLATQSGDDSTGGQPANGEAAQTDDGSTFITLLQPTDLSALVTARRGAAELVTEQKRQMLRLKSIRQDGSTAVNAQPILLELERGVLRQINGKEVTVEFYAKSGGSGPAQFAIQCDIGGDSVCGRKRFRVGLQPERILFSLDLKDGFSTEERAYLAINTDITNAAETTGSGDEIDIIHVRLRLNDPQS